MIAHSAERSVFISIFMWLVGYKLFFKVNMFKWMFLIVSESVKNVYETKKRKKNASVTILEPESVLSNHVSFFQSFFLFLVFVLPSRKHQLKLLEFQAAVNALSLSQLLEFQAAVNALSLSQLLEFQAAVNALSLSQLLSRLLLMLFDSLFSGSWLLLMLFVSDAHFRMLLWLFTWHVTMRKQ